MNYAEGLKMAYKTFGIPVGAGTVWYEPYISHAYANAILYYKEIEPGTNIKRKDVVWILWKLAMLKPVQGM